MIIYLLTGSKLYFLLQRLRFTSELCPFGIVPGGKSRLVIDRLFFRDLLSEQIIFTWRHML